MPAERRHSREHGMRLGAIMILEQENTMKAITELAIAALAVAFLVAVAVQIDHAHAGSPALGVHDGDATTTQGTH
jgi:hypothetical protein